MSIPINNLSREQKSWYAGLVVGAIIADGEINVSEVEFLKEVISLISDPAERSVLMGHVVAKTMPELVAPPTDIGKEIIAAIFVELIMISISDFDFDPKEKAYLKKIAQITGIDDSYYKELMDWAHDGINWKISQKSLFPNKISVDDLHLDVDTLSENQKKWYAQILIATIMLDPVLDPVGKHLLKVAIFFVKEKKDKAQLMAYVLNKMCPPILEPPDISITVLTLILIEVMMFVSADELITFKERTHLKTITEKCGFSEAQFNSMLNWCNKGIAWKRDKSPLIGSVKMKPGSSLSSLKSGVVQHPENNSIIQRNFGCFICGRDDIVKIYQLKPNSQKQSRNIFGIVTFEENINEFDFIDYNLIKPIVCPSCFFTAPSKELFRKDKNQTTPTLLDHQEFKEFWLDHVDERKNQFQNSEDELFSIKRSPATIIKSYQLAIKVANALAKMNNDVSQAWQVVTLTLHLAEILSAMNDGKKADQSILQAEVMAEKIFKTSTDSIISIKAARLLFLIGLYHNDQRKAGKYMNFISDLQIRRADSLKPDEAAILKKIFGETKRAFEYKRDYKKENLVGFHLDSDL